MTRERIHREKNGATGFVRGVGLIAVGAAKRRAAVLAGGLVVDVGQIRPDPVTANTLGERRRCGAAPQGVPARLSPSRPSGAFPLKIRTPIRAAISPARWRHTCSAVVGLICP